MVVHRGRTATGYDDVQRLRAPAVLVAESVDVELEGCGWMPLSLRCSQR